MVLDLAPRPHKTTMARICALIVARGRWSDCLILSLSRQANRQLLKKCSLEVCVIGHSQQKFGAQSDYHTLGHHPFTCNMHRFSGPSTYLWRVMTNKLWIYRHTARDLFFSQFIRQVSGHPEWLTITTSGTIQYLRWTFLLHCFQILLGYKFKSLY